MHTEDEEKDLEFEALLEKFSEAAGNGFEGFYMDSEDLFDIVSYFIDEFDIDRAEEGFEAAFKLFPNDPFFKLLHSKLLVTEGLYTEAEKELRSLEKLHPDMPEIYVEKVLMAQLTHQKVDAFKLLNKAISLKYELPEAHSLLALEFLHKSDIDQAFSHIQTAVSQDKFTLMNLDMFIFASFTSFKSDDLIDLLTRLSDEYPLHEEVWRLLGMTYFCLGKNQEALNAFQFQYSLNPDNLHILFNMADCYYRMRDYENALKQYIEFKKAGQYPVDVMIGRCHYMLMEYDKALQDFIQADPADPLYLFRFEGIIKVCREMDNLPMARNILRDLWKKETETPVILSLAPRLLSLLHPIKDQDEILDIFDRLFYLDQSEYEFFRLVLQLTYFHNTNEAIDLSILIVKHFQDYVINDTFVQYCLGILYMEKGWEDKGTFHLEKAFSAMNQDEFEDFFYMTGNPFYMPQVCDLAERYSLQIPAEIADVIDLFEEDDEISEDYLFDFPND